MCVYMRMCAQMSYKRHEPSHVEYGCLMLPWFGLLLS